MRRKSIVKIIALAIVIVACMVFYYSVQVPYKISEETVKSIYCTYWNADGEYKIHVNDSDKQVILSEIRKMRNSGVEGQAGTLGYTFTVELIDGTNIDFYQNTDKTVSLQRDEDHFFRNIKAPKTAEFIKRFIAEHNIDI